MKLKAKDLKINYSKMRNRMKINNIDIVIIAIFFLLIFVKLYLVSGQTLFAISHAGHDDRLFLLLSESLIRLNWLGDYNNLTLAKGVFYPLYIAFNFYLGLPLLFSEHLLYILASIIFSIGIKPLIKKSWVRLLIFAFILFNPITFTNEPFTRVIREGVYISLTLLVIAFTLGWFLRRKSYKRSLLWSLGLGIVLGAFWHTREEGIWIIPYITVLFGYYLFENVRLSKFFTKTTFKLFIPLIIPFLILFTTILSISLINYKYYGEFNTVEFKSSNFVKAYGALTSVKSEQHIERVPVTKNTRQKIYEESPAFKELEVFLEGDVGKAWASGSDEIQGGWFMWALRDAVAYSGYYKDGATSESYYARLADEISNACLEKRLDCPNGVRNSMNPPFEKSYFSPLIKTTAKAGSFVVSFDNFSPYSSTSGGNSELMVLFEDLTRENINPLPAENLLPNQTLLNSYKLEILGYIGKFYTLVNPVLFILSSILFFSHLLNIVRNRKISSISVILSGLFLLFITRLVLISYIHLTSFGAINQLYLSPAYIVLACFTSIALGYFIDQKSSKSN